MKLQNHPYHLVSPSPWPITISLTLLIITISIVMILQGIKNIYLIIGIISFFLIISFWWKDIIIESSYLGYHTNKVQNGIKIGFILFIITEILFFISIFWAYLHSSLSPSIELGSIWPPLGIEIINPWEIPLLNTLLLLSSGITITLCHNNIIVGNKKNTIKNLLLTIILAIIFTILQIFEYFNASFTFSDSVFGSIFFLGTGFHAFHILIGNSFLIICLLRIINNQLTKTHHLGLELSIIYWHFVDIIWLILFILFYYWIY